MQTTLSYYTHVYAYVSVGNYQLDDRSGITWVCQSLDFQLLWALSNKGHQLGCFPGWLFILELDNWKLVKSFCGLRNFRNKTKYDVLCENIIKKRNEDTLSIFVLKSLWAFICLISCLFLYSYFIPELFIFASKWILKLLCFPFTWERILSSFQMWFIKIWPTHVYPLRECITGD